MGLNLETYIGAIGLFISALLAFLAALDLHDGASNSARALAWISMGVAAFTLVLYIIAHLRKGRVDWHDIAHYIVFAVVIVLTLLAALDINNTNLARTLLYIAAGVAVLGFLLGIVLDITTKTHPYNFVHPDPYNPPKRKYVAPVTAPTTYPVPNYPSTQYHYIPPVPSNPPPLSITSTQASSSAIPIPTQQTSYSQPTNPQPTNPQPMNPPQGLSVTSQQIGWNG